MNNIEPMPSCCKEMYSLGVQDGIRGNFFRFYEKKTHFISLENYFNEGNFVFTCSCGIGTMNIEEANKHQAEIEES